MKCWTGLDWNSHIIHDHILNIPIFTSYFFDPYVKKLNFQNYDSCSISFPLSWLWIKQYHNQSWSIFSHDLLLGCMQNDCFTISQQYSTKTIARGLFLFISNKLLLIVFAALSRQIISMSKNWNWNMKLDLWMDSVHMREELRVCY